MKKTVAKLGVFSFTFSCVYMIYLVMYGETLLVKLLSLALATYFIITIIVLSAYAIGAVDD